MVNNLQQKARVDNRSWRIWQSSDSSSLKLRGFQTVHNWYEQADRDGKGINRR